MLGVNGVSFLAPHAPGPTDGTRVRQRCVPLTVGRHATWRNLKTVAFGADFGIPEPHDPVMPLQGAAGPSLGRAAKGGRRGRDVLMAGFPRKDDVSDRSPGAFSD